MTDEPQVVHLTPTPFEPHALLQVAADKGPLKDFSEYLELWTVLMLRASATGLCIQCMHNCQQASMAIVNSLVVERLNNASAQSTQAPEPASAPTPQEMDEVFKTLLERYQSEGHKH